MVRVCLNCGANPKIAKKHGLNILMTASQNRHLEIVKHVILCGADVNADSNGLTALMWAARFEHSEIVKHLVSQGANINAIEYRDGTTALIRSAENGKLEMVKCLVLLGVDINMSDMGGRTALSWALERNYPKIANYLKANGARL